MNKEIADNSRACCNCANATMAYPNCYCWQHKYCNGDRPYEIPKDLWEETAKECKDFEFDTPEEADVYLELHRIMCEESKDKNPKPMKANELMIGDWVYAIDGERKKHPCRIATLEYDSTNKMDDFSIDFYGTDYEVEWPDVSFEVEPIPLTSEILEKNGFIPATNGVSWYLWDDDTDECLLMFNKIHNAFVMSTAGMTIGFQYVHQLQHVFRLCGIKKEITI